MSNLKKLAECDCLDDLRTYREKREKKRDMGKQECFYLEHPITRLGPDSYKAIYLLDRCDDEWDTGGSGTVSRGFSEDSRASP